MRSTILIAALAGATAASPLVRREDIDFDLLDATPAAFTEDLSAPIGGGSEAPTYDVAAAVASAAADPITTDTATASKMKRGAICAAQPLGSGPVPKVDTDVAFLAMPDFNKTALNARYPNAYSVAYGPVQASQSAGTYLGYYTLDSYDPLACQAKCDANKKACWGFNIYFERDPTQDANDDSCKNPPSTTNIKCALYGSNLDPKGVKNVGQWRNKFHVVIAGSMGFNKVAAPDAVPGWLAPVGLPGSINAPDDSFMGSRWYPGPYNPSQCLAACTATNDYKKKQNARPENANKQDTRFCTFVNTYVLSENFVAGGTMCGLYTTTWSPDYATNYGQWRGDDRYTISQSYGWTLNQA